jgi:hypothetical protein
METLTSILGWDTALASRSQGPTISPTYARSSNSTDAADTTDAIAASSPPLRSLVFVDDGYAEAFKWNLGTNVFGGGSGGQQTQIDKAIVVLPFSSCCSRSDDGQASCNVIRAFNADRVAFFVSTFLVDSLIPLNAAITTAGCADVTVVTMNGPDACKVEVADDTVGGEEDYDFVKSSFSPIRVRVVYFPLHIVRMMSSQDQNVRIFCLSVTP